MATNEILLFAETDTGTNLLTQAEYLADSQRPIGNQPGVARSKLVNKALRQASLISAGVAKFLADNQTNNITDSLTPQNIASYMESVVRSLGIPTAVAGGTADAITADFTPNVSLTNGITTIVRAGSANATTAPTFAPDGLAAKTIVKGNNLPLVAGDIAGAGHWLELNFDSVLDKWVLQNPAMGFVRPGFSNLSIVTATGNFTVPAGVYLLDVELWGGGGGGGGSGSGGGTAGGGGGGGYASGIYSVTPGQVIACTIGAAGGGGGGGGAGTSGGTTSFGALISATGGVGGQPNPSGNSGAGGTGTGGIINLSASAGTTGAASNVQGGAGAAAPMGGGGGGGAQGSAGAGAVPGGGGGGGGSSSSGGAGARGQIHVRY